MEAVRYVLCVVVVGFVLFMGTSAAESTTLNHLPTDVSRVTPSS